MRRPVTGLVISAFAIPMVFLGADEDGQRDTAPTEPDSDARPALRNFTSLARLPDPAFAKADDGVPSRTDRVSLARTASDKREPVFLPSASTGLTDADNSGIAVTEPAPAPAFSSASDPHPVVVQARPSVPARDDDLPEIPSVRPDGVVTTGNEVSAPLPGLDDASLAQALPPPEDVTDLAQLRLQIPVRETVWDAETADLHPLVDGVHIPIAVAKTSPVVPQNSPAPAVIVKASAGSIDVPNNGIAAMASVSAAPHAGVSKPVSNNPRKDESVAQEMFALARFDTAPLSEGLGHSAAVSNAAAVIATTVPMIAVEPHVSKADRLPMPAFGQTRTRLEIEASDPASMGVSQADRVQTLQDALRQSYIGNPRLLAERASLRSADYDYTKARSVYGPQLDAFATIAYTYDQSEIVPGTFRRNQGWTQTAGLILTQPLLTFGRGAASEGRATANVDYRRASLRITQDRIAFDVISAYVGSVREAGAVTIARENVRLLQQELADARMRFDLADMTATDLEQVQARLALGQSVLLDAKARLSREQALFYSVVGVAPGELALPERLELPFKSISDAYRAADIESPLIWAAKARERISRSQLAAADAERRPSVSFRGTADYAPLTDYSSDLHAKRLRGQITLSIPLLDGGRRFAEIGTAQEANQADWRLIDAAMRETRADVGTSWNRLLAAQQSVEFYQTAVRSAKEAFDGAKVQERAGLRTTLEVLDLARDLLNVRNGYNQALSEEYLARASLLSAVGRLNPELLVPDMERYEPERHFARIRRNSDIPLLTGLLSGLDELTSADLLSDRPSRDTASLIATGAFAPEP